MRASRTHVLAGTALAVGLAAAPLALSSHGGVRDQSASWSPDGTQILFTTNPGGGGQIWVAGVDGTGHRRVGRHPSASTQAEWSPDGRRIAFASGRSGGWDIYAMDADGGGETRITTSDRPDFAPSWSPDGTRIAFYRMEAQQQGAIWVVGADGSGERVLATAGNNGEPSWSPDGRRIAFQSHRDGNWELYVMDADGSDQTRLTRTPDRHEGEPSWTPDGRILFSAGGGDGERDVYVVEADGTGERRLTTLARGIWGPKASPDGTRIAFFEFPPGTIWLADADGSEAVPLFSRLSVAALTRTPRTPRAGGTFAVALRVAGPAAGARATCRATIAGKPLRVLGKSFSAATALCRWRIPADARGKRLRATIGAVAENGRAARSFSAVVR